MPAIKNWKEDDRPREKLLQKGVNALSDAELLAILIHSGTSNASALDMAKALLHAHNNDLQKLASRSVKEIIGSRIKGFGPAKAITIMAALELGVRRNITSAKKLVFTHSSDVANFLRAQLQYLQTEVFAVIYLNQANKILHYEVISEGGITGTVADPRVILKNALLHNATNLILSHNHPSGSLRPSRADQELTRKISEAARVLDIRVLDHIIVSENGYYSFADDGLM
jgi:DNA repair protein RadC